MISEDRRRVDEIAKLCGMSVVENRDADGVTFDLVPRGLRFRIRVGAGGPGYVGATYSVEPSEGEHWRRGGDLPDGANEDETWLRIEERICLTKRESDGAKA